MRRRRYMRELKMAGAAMALLLFLGACDNGTGAVSGSGTIEAEEVTISARTAGVLLDVPVREGEHVAAGDLLARVDPTALELELAQANAGAAASRAQLDLLLAGARQEDIRMARAELSQASQAVELAGKSLERTRELFEGNSATRSELDRAQTEFEQARARREAAQAQVAKVESMPRAEEVRAAQAQLEQAEAAAKRVRHRIEETGIRAPRSGIVVTVVHRSGEYVGPGTPLVRLADLSTVELTVYVPEPALQAIRVGQEATVRVDGAPERRFTGTVRNIADEAEFTPKNVQTEDARAQLVYAVEIGLSNEHGVFKIGMPAEAELAAAPEAAAR